MNIIVTGSIAFDYLMSFPGKFTEHFLPEHMNRVSLSFLVDSMDKRRGGCAPNIAYYAGAARRAAAADGARPGRTSTTTAAGSRRPASTPRWCKQVDDKFTASFFCSTDADGNQIASFYTGAMANAAELSFRTIGAGLAIISPNDPAAMLQYAEECRTLGVPYIWDPGQQCARMSGDELRDGLVGAALVICNDYEYALIQQKTGLDEAGDPGAYSGPGRHARRERAARFTRRSGRIDVAAVPPHRIVDPTGVGDAFRSGFLKGMARGASYRDLRAARQCRRRLRPRAPGRTEPRLHVGRVQRPLRRAVRRAAAAYVSAKTASAARVLRGRPAGDRGSAAGAAAADRAPEHRLHRRRRNGGSCAAPRSHHPVHLGPGLSRARAAVAAAATRRRRPTPCFRSGANLVSVNVSVLDGTGRRFVTDLSRADFAIYEDGVQQQVSFFESSQVPVDLIVMLDTSSSMSDKMSVVHEAANNFLRTLRAGDRGAVISFADQVQVIEAADRRSGQARTGRQLDGAHGGTALNNALYVALRQFGGAAHGDGPVRRRAVALLTDGEDTSSVVSFDDVLELARKSGVNIYTHRAAVARRARRRRRQPQVPLAGAVLDEVAGPGNRRRGLLPGAGERAAGRLRLDRPGALQPVLDWLHAEQRARRRALPTDCRCGSRHIPR